MIERAFERARLTIEWNERRVKRTYEGTIPILLGRRFGRRPSARSRVGEIARGEEGQFARSGLDRMEEEGREGERRKEKGVSRGSRENHENGYYGCIDRYLPKGGGK